MTHTSTEQPYALRLADEINANYFDITVQCCATELRRLHARVQELEAERAAIIAEKDEYKVALRAARTELEASQAQRVPLSDAEIGDFWEGATGGHSFNDETRRDFVRSIEQAHGITQEKQG